MLVDLFNKLYKLLVYETELEAHCGFELDPSTAFLGLVQRAVIAVVFCSSLVADMGTPNASRIQCGPNRGPQPPRYNEALQYISLNTAEHFGPVL